MKCNKLIILPILMLLIAIVCYGSKPTYGQEQEECLIDMPLGPPLDLEELGVDELIPTDDYCFGAVPDPCERLHLGTDFSTGGEEGKKVLAMANGIVYYIPEKMSETLGWFIVLKHSNGSKTLYSHLKEKPNFQIDPDNPTYVLRGDVIGKSGNTGHSNGPHLHVELIGPGCKGYHWTEYCGHLNPYPCIESKPEIVLAPTQFEFEVVQNGAAPSPQYVSITNGRVGTLKWQVSADANWLDVSPTEGYSNSAEITVSVNTTDLAPGTYTATITVSSTNAINSPQYVTVTYKVNPSQAVDILEIHPDQASGLYFSETDVMGRLGLRVAIVLGPEGATIPGGTTVEFFVDGQSLGEVPVCEDDYDTLSQCVHPGWYSTSPLEYHVPNVVNDTTVEYTVRLNRGGDIVERTGKWPIKYNWNLRGQFDVTFNSRGDDWSSDGGHSFTIVSGYGILGTCSFCYPTNFFGIQTQFGGTETFHDTRGCVWLAVTDGQYFPQEGDILHLEIRCNNCDFTECPLLGPIVIGYFLVRKDPGTVVWEVSDPPGTTPCSGHCTYTSQLQGFVRLGKDDYPNFSFSLTCNVTCSDGSHSSRVLNSTYEKTPDGASPSGKLSTGNGVLETNDSLVNAGGLPTSYILSQNSPNPFNPETEISFSLPERTQVSLIIYNILGKKVKTLMNETRDAGTYNVRWNGSDEAGNQVASGIYFYRLKTEAFEKTMKMVMMK